MEKKFKLGILAIISVTVITVSAFFVFAPRAAEAGPFDGYGDVGQPPAIAAFYLNETGSAGITNDMWGASVSNIGFNYRFLSMGMMDKVFYSVWRTQGPCDISNPSMSGNCIPAYMMKTLSEDMTNENGVEAEDYNRPIYVQPGNPYSDGTYVMIMSAVTAEGYINSTQALWFGIDQTPPLAPILQTPENGSNTDGNIQFDWTTTDDDIYQYEFVIDQNPSQILTNSNLAMSVTAGTHTWKVRAIDKVGNIGPWSEEWSFTVSIYEEDDEVIDDRPEAEGETDESDGDEILPPLGTPQSGPGSDQPTAPGAAGGQIGSVGAATFSGTTADESLEPSDEAEDEGEVLGTETEDLTASAAEQAESAGLLGMLRSWLFWVIVAAILAYLIWFAWKRRRENKEEEQVRK